jgi:WD40 repeat protein
VVDLRWGISPSVATTHDTIQICLDEVIRCQQLSPRPKPNFLMLIGDRYGWRPPAVEISDADFRLIKKAVSFKDAAFLLSWYRKDTNAVPPAWCLKPRTDDYASYETWGPVESRITSILHEAAEKLGLSPEQYLYSATHMEIVNGLLQLEGAQDHIFSFNRELRGLPDSAPKGITRRFADFIGYGSRDPESRELLEVLKQQIAQVLPATQIHTFQADWLGHDDTPISTDHIDKFCSDVETSLLSVIKPELEQIAAVTPFQEELELQCQFLQETGSLLIGRDRELNRIRAYLGRKKTPLPLIIRAAGGAGKSALLAKAILGHEEEGASIIYRFIGAAPRSWQPQTFLEDLIQQIAEAYGQEPPPLPEEGGIKRVAELFHEQLELATEEQPLTIFIDAIDQFNSTSPVQYSDLFPKQLPANVRMVISILEGKDSIQLEKLYPKAPLIYLKQLSPAACGKILDALLQGRKLTKEQLSAILAKSIVSGLPLWLTLAAPIARKLNSWDTQPDLPGDIKDLARYVIKRIADKHGHAITTASLRYIKLARFGLSETELQELLWADPNVRAEFDATRNPDQPEVDALPPVFWSRLYAELDPYINEYWMDGQLLHRYFHRVFGEVADEMDDETSKTLHGRLADYFDKQPLYLDQLPNGRKLMEQGYQLLQAGRTEEARATITDFDFAVAKCRLNRSDDWANDFRMASHGEKTRDYRIWESFVKTNAHILRRGNDEWPAHKILLQLAIEHADDSPATIGAKKFLADGKCDWGWLRMEQRAEHAGISNCLAVMEGHTDWIAGVHLLPNDKALSWSGDGTLRLWELNNSKCITVMEGHTDLVAGVHLLSDGNALTWSDDNTLRLWNFENRLCIHLMEGHTDNIWGVYLLPDRKALSWSSDCTLRLWDIKSGQCLAIMEGHTYSVNGCHLLPNLRVLSWSADDTLRLWDLSNGRCIAIMSGHTDYIENVHLCPAGKALSWSADDTLRLWDLSNGQCIAIMSGHTDNIVGVHLCPKGKALSWSEDCTLRLWDIESGECIAVMKGHTKYIQSVHLLPDNKALSWSADSMLRIWDLKNGICQKVLEGHTDHIWGVHLLTGSRALSWSDDDSLRLWDLESGRCLFVMKGHTEGIQGVQLLPGDRAISWSNDKSIRLWSMKSGQCLTMMERHSSAVDGVHYLDNRLISWSDNFLYLWDLEGEQFSTVVEGHSKYVQDVHILPKGRFLTCSGSDKTICLWDSTTGKYISKVNTLKNNDKVSGKIFISSNLNIYPIDNDRVIAWSTPFDFCLWGLNNGLCLAVMEGHTDSIKDIKLMHNNKVISWSADRTIRLWSLETGQCLMVMEGHTEGVTDVQLLSGGKLISCSRDGTLLMWEDGICLKIFKGHTKSVWNVRVISDNRILSWSADGTIRLWDTENTNCLAVMEGHESGINGVHLLPKGKVLSWSDDKTMRLWNIENGQCLTIMESSSESIENVRLVNNDKALSWSKDKFIRSWDINTGELLAAHDGNMIFNAPKEIWQTYLGKEKTIANAGLYSTGNTAILGCEHSNKLDCLVWHAASECTARHLFDDGRSIVTQTNGQVCLLRAYHGDKIVTTRELVKKGELL